MPPNITLEQPPELMASPEALGAMAVTRAQTLAELAITDSLLHEGHANVQAYELQGIRDSFNGLDDRLKKNIGNKLLAEKQPEWLLTALGEAANDPINLVNAISAKNAEDTYTVSDETLVNVMQWHNYVESELQKQFESETIAPMRQVFSQRMEKAVADGWVPANTLDDERRALIANTPVYIDDDMGLDRHFHGFLGRANAYAHSGQENSYIVFKKKHAEKSSTTVEATFTHEMTHILTGHSPDNDDQKGTYGMSRLIGDNNVGTALNEAVTEHFAQALISGNIDKIRPLKGPYKTERYLLKALCNRGKEVVDPRLFAGAMFSGKSRPFDRLAFLISMPENIDPAITALKTTLNAAFPAKDIIEILNKQLTEASMIGIIAIGQTRKVVHQL